MNPFRWEWPYSGQRMPVLADNVVATSQPLAAQAGLQMLHAGGNAVDAALAAAIALTVVEPTSNGIGGDAFALVWDGERLHGLNGSGRAPAAWSPARWANRTSMPTRGWDAVTVPGAVSTWTALSERWGKLPFADLFAPAIAYARDGFLVGPIVARAWRDGAARLGNQPGFADAFLPGGRAPEAGQRWAFADQAATLERIADTGGRDFYTGDLARQMAAHCRACGGVMTEDDLAAHQADWVDPVSVGYRGHTVHELPPNGQGVAALQALGMLQHTKIFDYPVDGADSLHLQIEAMKLAFADTYRQVADPASMHVGLDALLDPDYLVRRARLIDPTRAQDPGAGAPPRGGTVYVTAADGQGNMVSFIQSNYLGFGSGVVVPRTGISLQNRGCGFSLEDGHPNQVGGRKRPFHTIMPAFVTKEGRPLVSFGVMGGPMQPQGHVQVMVRLCDYGQNPQAVLDAPRWQVTGGLGVHVENGFEPDVLNELARRGHEIEVRGDGGFGGGQLIYRLASGFLAASDKRKDGQAVGF